MCQFLKISSLLWLAIVVLSLNKAGSFTYQQTGLALRMHEKISYSQTTIECKYGNNRSSDMNSKRFISQLKKLVDSKNQISKVDRMKLYHSLIHWIPRLSHTETALLTWCVGTMKLSYHSEDMVVVSDMLFDRLSMHRYSLTAEDMAISLVGFARLGVKFPTISSVSFLDCIPSTFKGMDNQQLANSIWALGKLGVKWNALPMKSQKAVCEAVTLNCRKMTHQGVANTLQGLSNIVSHWSDLPTYLTHTLLKSIELSIHDMIEMEVSNTISGLGRLGVQWTKLNPHFKRTLIAGLLRTSRDQNSKGLAMTIHGLGKMSVSADDLPTEIKRFLTMMIIKFCGSLNAVEISNVVYGLGKMGSHIMDDVTNEEYSLAREGLYAAIARESWRFTPQGVSNVLWGLMLLHVKWDELPDEVTSNLLNSVARESRRMSEQELGNMIYALGKLGVKWTKFSEEMKTDILMNLEHQCPHMTSAGIVMVLMGLGRLELMSCEETGVRGSVEHRSSFSQRTSSNSLRAGSASCNSLPSAVVSAICDASSRVLQNANDESVSILIHALASSGFRWESLGPKLQTAVEESISRSHWSLILSSSKSSSDVAHDGKSSLKTVPGAKYGTMPAKSSYRFDPLSKQSPPSESISSLLMDAIGLHQAVDQHVKKSKGAYNAKITKTTMKNMHGLNRHANILENFFQSHSETTPNHYHLIHSLGQLGAHWEYLGFSMKTALLSGLINSVDAMDERAVVNVFHGLANLHVKWSDLNQDVKSKLLSSLVRICDDMIEQGVSLTILSLAKLEISWQDDIPDLVKACLRRAIAKQAHLGEQAMSSILFGLGKMNRKWIDLHPEVRQTLKAAIVVSHIEGNPTAEGVANSVYGLGAMQADWSILSSSVRLALVTDITKIASIASETQLANIISGLGRMGVLWKSLPVSMIDALERRMIDLIPAMNEQHMSTLMSGLSSLGLVWYDMSSSIRENVLERYNQIFSSTVSSFANSTSTTDQMSAYGLMVTLSSWTKIGLKWGSFPSLEYSLNSIIINYTNELTASQYSSLVVSLSKLLCRWDNFPPKVQGKLISKLKILSQPSTVNALTLKEKSQLINGFGTFGLVWEQLKPPVLTELLQWSKDIARDGILPEIAGLIHGLGLMECSWDKLPIDLRRTLTDRIVRICDDLIDDSKNSIAPSGFKPWGYNSVGRRWHYVQPTISPAASVFSSTKILSSMQSEVKVLCQSLANLMYGLSLMTFDVVLLDNESSRNLSHIYYLLSESVNRLDLSKFSSEERHQILIFTHVIETLSHHPQYSADLSTGTSTLIGSINPGAALTKASKLQQSVVEAISHELKKLSDEGELKIVDEYSAFGGLFPVDATVFEGSNPVAFVEVDGPQHFKDGGVLRRKDVMKEALYKAKYPCAPFTRVRFDQVNRLGSQYVGHEISNFITFIRRHQKCSTEIDYHPESEIVINQEKVLIPIDGVDDWTSCGCDMNGFIIRTAERELKYALDGKFQDSRFLRSHTRIFDYDTVCQDEDNS